MEFTLTKNEENAIKVYANKVNDAIKELNNEKKNSVNYMNIPGLSSSANKNYFMDINIVLKDLELLEKILKNEDLNIDIKSTLNLVSKSFKGAKLTNKEVSNALFYFIKRNIYENNFSLEDEEIKEAHLLIKKHYFDKQVDDEIKDFSKEDLEQIKVALHILPLNRKTIETTLKYLTTLISTKEIVDLNNREKTTKKRFVKPKKEEKPIYVTHDIVKLKKKEVILTNKEYNEIDNELLNYFSFNRNASSVSDLNNSIMIFEPLSENDRMRCVFLLRKAKYDISTIKTFLEKSFIRNARCMNILQFYNEIYEMISKKEDEYYDFHKSISDINDILKEMNFADESTYRVSKELMRVIIDEMLENTKKEEFVSYYLKRTIK